MWKRITEIQVGISINFLLSKLKPHAIKRENVEVVEYLFFVDTLINPFKNRKKISFERNLSPTPL